MLEALTLHPQAFGLDISDIGIKIAFLEKKKQGFQLHSFGEFSLPSGIVEKGEIKQQDELAKVLRDAVARLGNKLPTREVVVSLPEEQAFLQVVQLPRMKKEELEHAVVFEAENYIPHSIEKVYLDFQVVRPYHNHLDHTDVLLAALPRITVDSYVTVLEKAGLTPRILEIESLSVARALVFQETSPTPVLLVDFGATRTSFVIFSGHSLRFTASIGISSHQLTQAIARGLKVNEKEAEELKIRYGLERQDEDTGRKVFELLVPPLSDLIEQIKRHITYYESHSPHQHLPTSTGQIRRVVISGGGANLRGFSRFLNRELEREVTLGNPWVNILETSLKELPPLPFGESLRYTAALGLALRASKAQ